MWITRYVTPVASFNMQLVAPVCLPMNGVIGSLAILKRRKYGENYAAILYWEDIYR